MDFLVSVDSSEAEASAFESAWGVHDNGTLGTSGGSMGYPMLDTSTALHEERSICSGDDSDWSLLREDAGQALEKTAQSQVPVDRKKPQCMEKSAHMSSQSYEKEIASKRLDPYQNNNACGPRTIVSKHIENATTETVDPSTTGSESFFQQAATLVIPKPTRVPIGIQENGRCNTNGYLRTNEMRCMDALIDLDTHEIAPETRIVGNNETVIYTVRKSSATDKIGIFVGLKKLACGTRLVVSRVAPNGKFAESPIERGDIVVSINGTSFLKDPNPEDAFDIVRKTVCNITFAVLKRSDSVDDRSMDELPLPNLPYQHLSEMVNPDQSKTMKSEIWNKDGSQTIITELFDDSGRKFKQNSQRRWKLADGSTQDVSNVSLSIDGEVAILVKKVSTNQQIGLMLVLKKDHKGTRALTVSQVFPTGLFARTPLSEGDTILSINGLDFKANPDVRLAATVLTRTKGDVEVSALKSKTWMIGKTNRISQSRQLVESFKIPAPKSEVEEYDHTTYGGSITRYESAKSLKYQKCSPHETLGVVLDTKTSHWGTVLVVADVSPCSQMSIAGLQKGDIILTINGVDLSYRPDVGKAMKLLEETNTDIVMEYQRLGDLQEQRSGADTEVTESFKPDGTKIIRMETSNHDGSIMVKIEEIGPANPVDVAIEDWNGGNKPSDISEMTDWNSSFIQRGPHLSSASSKAKVQSIGDNSTAASTTSENLKVKVTKSHPAQDIGISVATWGGALYVTNVSPNGLMAGKPILPGDIILSINERSFRTNAKARDAIAAIVDSTKSITFELLKASSKGGQLKLVDVPKQKLYERLMCRRSVESSNMHLPSKFSTPPLSKGEECDRPFV